MGAAASARVAGRSGLLGSSSRPFPALVAAVSSELVHASFACALAIAAVRCAAVRSPFFFPRGFLVGLLLVPYRHYEILIARFTRYSMGLMAPPLVLFVRLPLAPVAPRRRLGGWVWSG